MGLVILGLPHGRECHQVSSSIQNSAFFLVATYF